MDLINHLINPSYFCYYVFVKIKLLSRYKKKTIILKGKLPPPPAGTLEVQPKSVKSLTQLI